MATDERPQCAQFWITTGARCPHPAKYGYVRHGSAQMYGYCGVHVRSLFSDGGQTVLPWDDLSEEAKAAIRDWRPPAYAAVRSR